MNHLSKLLSVTYISRNPTTFRQTFLKTKHICFYLYIFKSPILIWNVYMHFTTPTPFLRINIHFPYPTSFLLWYTHFPKSHSSFTCIHTFPVTPLRSYLSTYITRNTTVFLLSDIHFQKNTRNSPTKALYSIIVIRLALCNNTRVIHFEVDFVHVQTKNKDLTKMHYGYDIHENSK